jgi:S-DNA-T family DNA segregation ATPase FtsK/SpoIIIE
MIVSLLYNSSPEDVRLIMVDPKMLELSIYEGIPHLLLPVVTDPKKANLALRWAVEEMDRRYDLLATLGVRDINTYNRKVGKLQKQWEAEQLERAAEEARRIADEEEPVEVTEERGQLDLAFDEHRPPKRLPKIVVIIDEFADLMMCAPKEVETSVARIAQKARAAGIHLIIATQRPSVDVITGLIKANFPSRAAFRVTAKVDSRTILDTGGAEALLGSGDMLFSDRGREVRRLHGCYLAEDEIREIVAFLKTQGKPVYNLDIIRPRDDDADAAPEDSEEADEMYDRAVALVAEARQVSISMIQRRLRVGYNRAARMVEMMEREGVVTPPDGTNRREVLVAPAA